MAEFKEVVKEYRRMCGTYINDYCNYCPLVEESTDQYTCPEYLLDFPDVVENIVMQWAVENPEPQYPMWIEAISSMYPKMAPTQAVYQPVPDDIAKKLGIEPITKEK